MSRLHHRGVALALASSALFLGASHGALSYRQPIEPAGSTGSLDQLSKEFREIARKVEPSVVHIEVKGSPASMALLQTPQEELPPGSPEEFFRRFFEGPFGGRLDGTPHAPESVPYHQYDVPRTLGAGSGWIYDNQGHVITNNHVVKNAESLIVKLFDGREFEAELVATDPATDIAVLRIDAGDLTPAVLSEQPAEQGDIVFAFGSPFEFEFSMSQGIVSGKGRRTGILGPSGYEDFIQTDAAINPGNSGGPLTNARGEIVGMNSSILTGSGFFGGIGFAIPTPMIRAVVRQLIDYNVVRRGQLGVYIQDDPQVLRSFGYEGTGAVVSDVVEDGPAARAHVEPGDVITELDGRAVEGADDLRQAIAERRPEAKVRLTLFRGGEYREVEVELGELQSQPMEAGAEPGTGRSRPRVHQDAYEPLRKLGIEAAATLSPDVSRRAGVAETSGVLVQQVRANSAAFAAGLRPGMVVTRVMDTPVPSVEALAQELSKNDLAAGVRLTVRMEGRDLFLFVRLPG